VIAYRAILDVPRELVQFVAKLLAAHRRALGTRRGTRLLTCYRQAVYVLAWFRQPTDVTNLGRGFGLKRATSYRYRDEGITMLAAQAPDLLEALERADADGTPHLILDGKIIDTEQRDVPSAEIHPVVRLFHPHSGGDAEKYPVALGITGADQTFGASLWELAVGGPGERLDVEAADLRD
jgi:hypothetical protein